MANKIIYINNKKATIDGAWLFENPGLRVLTLHTVGNGTVTASQLSGYPGETAIITPTYETYNRFSGYELIGAGSIQDNIYTFGNDNADLSAVFKPNTFTAVGLWEKGSNVSVVGAGGSKTGTVPAKYAYLTACTGEIPSEWHNTSEHWNPTNASAYNATLNPKATFWFKVDQQCTGKAECYVNINGTKTNSQTLSFTTGGAGGIANTQYYNKTFNTTEQGLYYMAANLTGAGRTNSYSHYTYNATAQYNSTGTNGSWTATGYAP